MSLRVPVAGHANDADAACRPTRWRRGGPHRRRPEPRRRQPGISSLDGHARTVPEWHRIVAESDHAHGENHEHHHDHSQEPGHEGRPRALGAVMVPFGAAASPDLTILPVFLASATAGVSAAVGSLAIFAAVTIGTIVGLTLADQEFGEAVDAKLRERNLAQNAPTPAPFGSGGLSPTSLVRSSGLEPPRAVKPTRPSTLRVYQFRHERRVAEYSLGLRPSTAAATVRTHVRHAAIPT
jgi:hypothetical protein